MITDLYQLVKTNVIGIMKDELGDKIVIEFVALIPKTYLCLTDNDIDYKNQNQLRFKSEGHNLYTEEFNKIALSSNYDKKLQTFYNIKSYPYGTSVGNLCKTELL